MSSSLRSGEIIFCKFFYLFKQFLQSVSLPSQLMFMKAGFVTLAKVNFSENIDKETKQTLHFTVRDTAKGIWGPSDLEIVFNLFH